ncbi:NAD-dependent epimerase/dehydratase family protein, partial [bacterium]|nr:NAD-dependent epimerase/dehydratase family protein [bacterium]
NNTNVELWGSGKPIREFLHVDDLAKSIIYFLNNPSNDHVYNIGSGEEISIKDLSTLISKTIGYRGEIVWDKSKPDGTQRKLVDSSKINNLGWRPRIKLNEGISKTYRWFKKNYHNLRTVDYN